MWPRNFTTIHLWKRGRGEGGGPVIQCGYETSWQREGEVGMISTTWVKHTDIVWRRSSTKTQRQLTVKKKKIMDRSFYAYSETCVNKPPGELRGLFANILKFAHIKWKNKSAIFPKEKKSSFRVFSFRFFSDSHLCSSLLLLSWLQLWAVFLQCLSSTVLIIIAVPAQPSFYQMFWVFGNPTQKLLFRSPSWKAHKTFVSGRPQLHRGFA